MIGMLGGAYRGMEAGDKTPLPHCGGARVPTVKLFCEGLIGTVNFNNDARVYLFMKIGVKELHEASIGALDLCFGCSISNAKYLIGVALWSALVLGALPVLKVLLPRSVFAAGVGLLGKEVAILVTFTNILFFDLFPFPPDAVFIPGMDFFALAAGDASDSEMSFAYHLLRLYRHLTLQTSSLFCVG
jgi:hypothetical protein